MNGNRGAKGSVNDRLISMLYRKRYEEQMKKKESYNRADREKQKEYLKKIQTFDIDNSMDFLDEEDKDNLTEIFSPLKDEPLPFNPLEKKKDQIDSLGNQAYNLENKQVLSESDINDLINLGKEITSFDPKTEDYDFDKYDYYELISTKTGIGSMASEDVIDIDKEIVKREDEITIIEEVSDFVDESKNLLSEIKFEITDIKASIGEQHTQEEIEQLEKKYQTLKIKVDELKQKYTVMKEKYNFEDYEILDNLLLIEAIDDYRDKASLDELENLVDACKHEVEDIDGIVLEEQRRKIVGMEIKDKKEEIKERDESFDKTKKNTFYLDSLEQQIAEEAEKQRKIINEIEKEMLKVETQIEVTTNYVYNTGRMFASFIRIAAGILTAPLSNRRIFGIMLGAGLINRGLYDLRQSLIPQEVQRTEVKEKYQSLEREILTTKDVVGTTLKLIDDSLYQIDDLKKNFQIKFEPYAEYIPEYRKVQAMMDNLQKKLNKKKEQVNEMNKTLSKQYEKNKQKVLRAS